MKGNRTGKYSYRLSLTAGIVGMAMCFVLFSCVSKSNQRVTNDKGNYSIVKLADWDYVIKNRSLMLIQTKNYDSLNVTGSLLIAPGNSQLSLDETFTAVVNELTTSLKDFQKMNEGYTEINGYPTRWLKLSYTLYNYKYISLRYYMMLDKDTPVMIDCSAINGTFEDFEEDFNTMVFSLRFVN